MPSLLSRNKFLAIAVNTYAKLDTVGNKAKWRVSKRVFQENSTPNFPKNDNFFTPWYAHVRFEIRPFPLLMTISNFSGLFQFCFIFYCLPNILSRIVDVWDVVDKIASLLKIKAKASKKVNNEESVVMQ